ncbi:MAG: phosphoribosylanthranilate isomerase [Dehalococcoidales bacterium]|nr:phosphoribosylanthranilate isomerase [Dehalococcoidales bacterium]
MIKVKICGITSLDDALVAVDAGADALGFVFYASSSRTIAPEVAADIVANLPPFVSKVGVFVDSDLETVRQIESFCHLDMVQLHGDESPGFCAALFPKVIKAFGMRGRSTLDALASYRVPAYLLDAYSPEMVGGTGKAFDWELAREATGLGRVILAGGLTPLNVRQAIESVGPYGVDVSTGVESSPGKKDAALVHAFVRAVKGTTWQKENEQCNCLTTAAITAHTVESLCQRC